MNCPVCNKPAQLITYIPFIIEHGDCWECENHHISTDFAVKMYNKI